MKKHQTPNTKHQRRFKLQSKLAAQGDGIKYPGIWAQAWLLRDVSQDESSSDLALGSQQNSGPVPNKRHPFDLEERTAKFGEGIVRFARKIPRNPANDRLIDQIVGAGTSIGANYLEANGSFSKKDFRFCISRCLKEAKETKHFLRMIAASEQSLLQQARQLYREAHELQLIFATMFRQ